MVPVKEKMKARCARQAPTNEEAMELPTEVTALANENEALGADWLSSSRKQLWDQLVPVWQYDVQWGQNNLAPSHSGSAAARDELRLRRRGTSAG